MKYRTFLVLLVIFIVVVGSLLLGLNPTPPKTPSIGGGGYDLSKPLYTLLLLLFTGLWTLILLIITLRVKDRTAKRRALLLTILGAVTALASIILYSGNLS